MKTLEIIRGGYSAFTGKKINDGYKVKNENGKTVALLLKNNSGGFMEYRKNGKQWEKTK